MMYGKTLADYPRYQGENDDSPRIQRAINECADRVLFIPEGEYQIAEPLKVENRCSIEMQKNAVLKAVKEMDFVLFFDTTRKHTALTGGTIDGNGLASCLCVKDFHHFTFKDFNLNNGKIYGLRVIGGCEMIATNIYCHCTMSGMAGNCAVSSIGGDSHYTDIVVVDYTVGFEMVGGELAGSNRLTRCHVWGGPVPAKEPGGVPEMLVDSVSFRTSAPDTILRDCYADTGYIGFQIDGNTRLMGCAYYNNPVFVLDNITVIDHKSGWLLVSDGYFTQHTEHATLYRGDNKNVIWRDNYIEGKDLHLPE